MNLHCKFSLAVTIVLLFQLIGSSALAQSDPWPILQSTSEAFIINLRDHRTLISTDLRDLTGSPRYRLVCFSSDYTTVEEISVRYIGGLLCGLAPTGTPVDEILGNGSLLATEAERGALYSRGNFEPPALIGACASYPDYGLTRTFSLRGFRLTLQFSDMDLSPDYQGDFMYRIAYRKDFPIGRMKLTVTVEPDPKATSATALPITYIDPHFNQEACATPITEWPVLQSVSKEITLNLRDPRTLVTVDLRDISGRPQYQLVCFAGTEEASGEFGILYTGGLLCGLSQNGITTGSYFRGATSLLLAEDWDSEIYTRAKFDPEEMIGPCATYPDYGLIRDFYLRGFRLTLQVSEMEVRPEYKGGFAYIMTKDLSSLPIGRMKLTVITTPDSEARSATALPSKYVNPNGVQEACATPILVEAQ